MKFLVQDTQAARHARIRAFLTPDSAVIAVILAAIDLEWTVRRVIDNMLAVKDDHASHETVSGLDAYDKKWSQASLGRSVSPLRSVVEDWDALKHAYQLRHDIVHGRQGTTGKTYAMARVQVMLAASAAICAYAAEIGADPYRKLRGAKVLSGPTRVKKAVWNEPR